MLRLSKHKLSVMQRKQKRIQKMRRNFFSWIEEGFVPIMRNQRNSDYCNVLSSVATCEGLLFAVDGKNIYLSEQQLIDSFDPPEHGVKINELWRHYRTRGITRRKNYPARIVNREYQKGPVEEAKIRPPLLEVKWRRVMSLPGEHFEDAIKRRVRKQPVTAFIRATKKFRRYKGEELFSFPYEGKIKHTDKGDIKLPSRCNHAVTIVGYSRLLSTGKSYFILLNSWGASWGQNGYMKLERFIGRLGEDAYYPVIRLS